MHLKKALNNRTSFADFNGISPKLVIPQENIAHNDTGNGKGGGY